PPPGAAQRRWGVSEIRAARHSLGTTGDRVEFVSDLLADRIRPLGVGQCGAATRTILRGPCNAEAPTISGAEQDSAGLRSPQSETGHVLPSETDSTQSVDEVLDRVESEVDPRSGRCRDDQTAFLGADVRIEAACGVPGQGPHLGCCDVHARDPVLDGLKTADRGPELFADSGVLDCGVGAPL